MLLSNDKKLINHLKLLKKNFLLYGIKAEFEAEGSTHYDILLLRSLTNKTNTKLYVKIGGVEAINDIKFLINIGVDGIIAPMVESKFAASKFLSFFDKNKIKKKIHLTIKIESKSAVENLHEISEEVKSRIDNVTIGRTDLAASYFNKNIYPNSNFITNKIIEISKVFKKNKITTCVGGSIDNYTIKFYSKNLMIKKNINKIETRKVMLPLKVFLNSKNALQEALKFEELYILMKNEMNELNSKSDLSRLSILKTRK